MTPLPASLAANAEQRVHSQLTAGAGVPLEPPLEEPPLEEPPLEEPPLEEPPLEEPPLEEPPLDDPPLEEPPLGVLLAPSLPLAGSSAFEEPSETSAAVHPTARAIETRETTRTNARFETNIFR
jgi:hypothetical protein